MLFHSRSRIGLMGNPSDGFYGKTISLSIANFWAEVTIMESARLVYKRTGALACIIIMHA